MIDMFDMQSPLDNKHDLEASRIQISLDMVPLT